MRKTGTYQPLGSLDYFIPRSRRPSAPKFALSPDLIALYGETSFALGQLNEMSSRLPDFHRFIKAYAIKEALLSSSIEGIHTTLLDLFSSTIIDAEINKETQLVLNYNKALDVALGMLHTQNLPLVSRVILAAHKALLSNGEG